MLIEVFRAGNAAAAAAGITAAHLAELASSYDGSNPAPCVIGHPKNDSPANGAVVKFEAKGNSLYADVPDKLPAFKPVVEGVKGGTILGRSMAFFAPSHPSNPTPGKFAPKHLGFLGGAAPGIANMPALASYFAAHPEATLTFSADDDLEITGDPLPAIVFEASPTAVLTFTEAPAADAAISEEPTVTDAEKLKAAQDKLAADQKAHDDQVQAFAATARASREAANAASVDALVAAGKVTPADKPDLVAAFNAVDGGEVIEFASDKAKASPVSRIVAIMAKGGKVAPVDEGQFTPPGEAPEFSAAEGTAADYEKAKAERNARYATKK